MAFVDSHLHFRLLAHPGHEWPTPATPLLYGDFGPIDLDAAIGDIPVDGAVLVQSQPINSDTDWILALAARSPLHVSPQGSYDGDGSPAHPFHTLERAQMAVRRLNAAHDSS